eukprot:GFUD01035294.1.p1 GENE.GFUD01035294.1~~GFUD01035294.1.p1  ORF type:complete len:206 (+),score=82.00 GFUD01035294.1:54-671(+)
MASSVLNLPSHMTGFLYKLGSQSDIYSYVSKPRMLPESPNRQKRWKNLPVTQGNGGQFRNKDGMGISIKRKAPGNMSYVNPQKKEKKVKKLSKLPSSSGSTSLPKLPKNQKKISGVQISKKVKETPNLMKNKEVAEQMVETESSACQSPPATVSVTDKETQICQKDADLFQFDQEMALLLAAIIGRTMEQSLLEIMEEEEIARMR